MKASICIEKPLEHEDIKYKMIVYHAYMFYGPGTVIGVEEEEVDLGVMKKYLPLHLQVRRKYIVEWDHGGCFQYPPFIESCYLNQLRRTTKDIRTQEERKEVVA